MNKRQDEIWLKMFDKKLSAIDRQKLRDECGELGHIYIFRNFNLVGNMVYHCKYCFSVKVEKTKDED